MVLAGLTVLVVDDHLDSLEITELALLRRGARVRAAPSASRADGKRDTPSLALSATAGSAAIRRALDAGFDAHAAKPIVVDDIVARVAQLTGR